MLDGNEGRGEIPGPPVNREAALARIDMLCARTEPERWIVILDCPCGEEHIAPAGEGYEPISEWRYAD
jgi:hypothetical protein